MFDKANSRNQLFHQFCLSAPSLVLQFICYFSYLMLCLTAAQLCAWPGKAQLKQIQFEINVELFWLPEINAIYSFDFLHLGWMILVCLKVANSQKHYFFRCISKLIYIITVHGVFKMLTESDFFQCFSICNAIGIHLIFEAIVEICIQCYMIVFLHGLQSRLVQSHDN